MNSIISKSGKKYQFDAQRQTRMAQSRYMDPTSTYEKVYYQVNVYDMNGTRLNFGFVDEIDEDKVTQTVIGVIDYIESPYADWQTSRFD